MRTLQSVLILCLAGGLAACVTVQSADSVEPGPQSVLESPTITIPAGVRLRVSMLDGVSTTKSSPGDRFEASLVDRIVVDGHAVLEKGARVAGRVSDVKASGRVKGRASLRLVLNSVEHNGDKIAIETKPFVAVAEASKGRDAAIIGGGAGVGAAIGAIAGGKKGAGIGALVGGGAGTGTVLATKGKDLHYPPETRLNFTLSSPVQISR